MIEVCPNCSNADIKQLESFVPDSELLVNCVGQCGLHSDQVVGFINGELSLFDTNEAFISAVKEIYE